LELTSLAFYVVIGIIGIVIASKIIKLLRNVPVRRIYQGINPNARFQSLQHALSDIFNPVLAKNFDIGKWGSQIQNAWEKAGRENERFTRNLFGTDTQQDSISDEFNNKEPDEFDSLRKANDASWGRTLDENTEYAKRILGLNRDESENDYEDPWNKTVQENSRIAEKLFQEPDYLDDDYAGDDYERPKKARQRERRPRGKRSKRAKDESLDYYDYEEPWVKASNEDAKLVGRMFGFDDDE